MRMICLTGVRGGSARQLETNGLDIIKGVPQNVNRCDRVHLWPGEESACVEEHIVSDWR